MQGLRVGLVDIETSHPQAWIPILQEMGCAVHGIYDSSSRFSREEIQAFARQHKAELYDSLESLADAVDVGIILTCNWDEHLIRARPFLERGKPVLIDKPVVGSVEDAAAFLEWERQGKVISGGSSLRFSSELHAFREELAARGPIRAAYAGCSGHPFYYGIHLVSLLMGLMGPEVAMVRHLSSSPWRAELMWREGISAVVELLPEGKVPFFVTASSDNGAFHLALTNVDKLYRDYLGLLMPCLAKRKHPLPLRDLLRAELSLIAALQSERQGGAWVELSSLRPTSPAWSGQAFARMYFSSQQN